MDTSVTLARRQQGEQTVAVAGVGLVFYYLLGSAQTPHLIDITNVRYIGINDVQGSFNHPLQSLFVLGCAHPMPVWEVSSQNAFCRTCFWYL